MEKWWMLIYHKAVKKGNNCKVIQNGKDKNVVYEKEADVTSGYTLMIAPFDFARHNKIAARQFFDNYAFSELTPKKADEYFLWFKKEVPGRIALLWEYMKKERPETQPFDYSPESLIPLWDWYETKIKQVPKSKKEIDYEVSIYPKWMEENVRKITMKYTDETLSLALDIAIYLGETIIKNYPNLYWGYFSRPRRDFYTNKPVIMRMNLIR